MKTQTLLAALMAASLNLTIAYAQNKDPYVAPKNAEPPVAATSSAENEASPGPVNLSICYEDFSVPLEMAAALQRTQLDDAALYAKLTASLGKNEVKQETFVVLRARSGQKAMAEGIAEMIYPTEYEAAKIPNAAGEEKKKGEEAKKADPVVIAKATGLATPALPTAFETKNTGFTIEIEPMLSEDRKFVDLRFVPEHVTLVGHSKWGQGISEAEMPEFECQRINTSATLRVGIPFLIGTMNCPPISKVDPDSSNRVWFAFITATLAK
jgi:hypothetical protein